MTMQSNERSTSLLGEGGVIRLSETAFRAFCNIIYNSYILKLISFFGKETTFFTVIDNDTVNVID